MRHSILVFYAAAVGLALTLPSRLFASCGQAFCPIETSSLVENPLGGGQLYLNFIYEYIDQDEPYIGTSSASVGELPRAHDECVYWWRDNDEVNLRSHRSVVVCLSDAWGTTDAEQALKGISGKRLTYRRAN
jgi:hypothetical protein